MAKLFREELYFEPRVINISGEIKWYGEKYKDKALNGYLEQTVYIRDNGSELLIYKLLESKYTNEMVTSTMKLICKVVKYNRNFMYGRELK